MGALFCQNGDPILSEMVTFIGMNGNQNTRFLKIVKMGTFGDPNIQKGPPCEVEAHKFDAEVNWKPPFQG